MLLSGFTPDKTEAGCDEAGRGCLAGPVYAASVVFPKDYTNEHLNDSKKLNEKQRMLLRNKIMHDAIAWAIASCTAQEIDEINILQASFLAMHRAINQLKLKPEFLLIDGNRFKAYPDISHTCIVKGDGKYLSIAAASILAKTERDLFMEKIHAEYPVYNWLKNKGYPTADHQKALMAYGQSPYHRKSFQLKNQLRLDF